MALAKPEMEVEISTINSKTGLYYHYLGQLLPIDGKWTIILYKDIKPIFESYRKTTAMYGKLQTLESQANHLHNKFYHHLTLKFELNKLDKDLREISSLFPARRQKRGWFNIFGTGLHTLFGVMDADDEKRINDAVTQLQDSNKKTLTIVEESLHITKATMKNFNETLNNIQANEGIINRNFEEITLLSKNLSNQVYQNKFSLTILNTAFLLLELTFELQKQVDSIKEIVLYTKSNLLSPSIISPDELYLELTQISKQLVEKELPFSLQKSNLNKFFSIIKTKTFFFKESLMTSIEVPLVNKQVFDLYKLYPYPVPSQTSNVFHTILPEFAFLAISKDKSQYIGLHSKNQLTRIEEQYFGSNLEIYDTTIQQICETSLFLNGDKFPENCNIRSLNLVEHLIQQVDINLWLIFVTTPIDFTYKCRTSSLKSAHFTRNSFILMQPACSGYFSNGLKIASSEEKKEIKNQTLELPEIPVDCCIEQEHKLSAPDVIPIKTSNLHAEDFILNQHRLEDLQRDINIEKSRKLISLYSNWWFWPLVSTVIMLLIILCLCCCCCPGCLKLVNPKSGCHPGNPCIQIWNNCNSRCNKEEPAPRLTLTRRSSYQTTPLPIQREELQMQPLMRNAAPKNWSPPSLKE